ncbi:TPA: hypothetical protein N0F65_011720 [Lagenidium giganteum]|uniref:Uncharacterized protein n=1 Tax=Lagenidium giganteum TaxID=4803 RepID=A0AAV2YGV8_9STRA|nr:TPA: hypothetical protein N0F65_011720 [Lagenidium giganteum]
MTSEDPGVVICRKRPNDDGVRFNLLTKNIQPVMTDQDVACMWAQFAPEP